MNWKQSEETGRGSWRLGIILIVVGTIAVAMPIVSSFASAVAFGSLLLLAGIAQTCWRVLDP